VYSTDKCLKLIDTAEKNGFERAKVNYYGEKKSLEKIRNNSRIEILDKDIALSLEKRVQISLGNNFPYQIENEEGTWEFKKFGENLRMYRYEADEFFKPHKDGHTDDGNLQSKITVLMYLNDTVGGETILMLNGPGKTDGYLNIKPVQGDVLMFEHSIWHEGTPVKIGKKYVLRTDAFYQKK
jgi:hypothetical protein